MTTKDQERKALETIRKIVENMGGEDSYIGTAFKGCFEIAEQNIDNDFADSMADRAELALKRAKEYADKADDMKAEADSAKAHLKEVEERHAQESANLNRNLEKEKEAFLDEAGAQLAAAQREIIELKARLYDYMTGAAR